MPVLHLDNLPEDLYRQLERLAGAHCRPVPEEAVWLLKDAVARHGNGGETVPPGRSQLEVLEEIIRNRYAPAAGTPDSVDLLREDRDR